MPIVGSAKVLNNIKKAKQRISATDSERAVFAILQTGAAMAATMTPVDLGNLLQSQTQPEITVKNGAVFGRVGYTARYAAAVHEMPGKLKGVPRYNFGKTSEGKAFGGGSLTGTYWANGAEPQFLLKGFERTKSQIPKLLKAIYNV